MTFYGRHEALFLQQWFLRRSRSDMPTDVSHCRQVRISQSRGQNDHRLLRCTSEIPDEVERLIHVARHAAQHACVLVFHANLECLDCWRHGLLWHTKKSLATGFCGVDNPGMNERKKVGRPPVAADKELVHGTLRLTRAQWEKVRMAGVPALRLLIDRWRPKKP